MKGFEQVGQPLLLVAKERQRVILGIEGVGEPILGVLQPVGQSILLVAQEGEGVGLGLEGVTCRLEFSGLLPSGLQRVVVGIEGLPPCGHGDVLGVQVGIGLLECCFQDHQLVGLGRRVVSIDGLGHRDDALVHQLLLNVGLQVPKSLEGIHLGLLRLDGDHGFGDVIEEFRPPFLQVGDLDPYVVLPEALDGGRGIGDLVHELRPPLLLVVDLCLQVVDDEGPGGHAGQRVEAAADRHLQVLVRLAVLVQQRHYLQRRREPSRRQQDRVARIHEVVIHGDVTRDRDRNLQVGGRSHVSGDGHDDRAALLDDDGHGAQRDGRYRRVGCRHSVHHEGCHGHDSHRLASLESDRPTFRRADPYRYGVDGADRVAGWIALERNGHHLVDLRCGPGVSVVGLPGRQPRPRLLGVEPVHVAHVVSGTIQDRLQLEDVVSVRTDVQLPVEGEVAGDGDRLTPIDAEECVTLGHDLTGLHPDAADPTIGRRVDGLQLVAAQLAPDGHLVGEGPDGHRLGDRPVHPRGGGPGLSGPRQHGGQQGRQPSDEEEGDEGLLHGWNLRVGRSVAPRAVRPGVIRRRAGSVR